MMENSPFLRAKPRVPSMGSAIQVLGPVWGPSVKASVVSSAHKASEGKAVCKWFRINSWDKRSASVEMSAGASAMARKRAYSSMTARAACSTASRATASSWSYAIRLQKPARASELLLVSIFGLSQIAVFKQNQAEKKRDGRVDQRIKSHRSHVNRGIFRIGRGGKHDGVADLQV